MEENSTNQTADELESEMNDAKNIAENAYDSYKNGKKAENADNSEKDNNEQAGSDSDSKGNSGDPNVDNKRAGNNSSPKSPDTGNSNAKGTSGPSASQNGANANSASMPTGTSAGTSGTTGAANAASATGSATAEAGAAAGTSAGAAAGASAGAAAGAAAGASTTAVATGAAAAGGSGATVGVAIGGIIALIALLFMFMVSGAIEELVPNVLLKPVGTTQAVISGTYEKAKAIFSSILDFFTGKDSEEEEVMVEDLEEATQYCIEVIDELLDSAYDDAQKRVKELCEEKGYDYQTTMDSLSAEGGIFNTTNYAFIISTYSVSTDFQNVTVSEFKKKLRDKLNIVYTITDTPQTKIEYEKVKIHKYEAKKVKVCVDEKKEHDADGNSTTEHEYKEYTIYKQLDEVDTREDGTGFWISKIDGEEVTNYVDAMLISHESHSDSLLKGMYVLGSDVGKPEKVVVKPTAKEVQYAEITLTPFQNEDVYTMFDVDPNGYYQEGYQTTNRQMIEARMRTIENLVNNILTTAHVSYETNGLTKEEIEQYLAALPEDISGNRKQVIKTALTLVGMVPYYYGGKAKTIGWNDDWWTECLPDNKGRKKYGLDCSGYVQWVFATAGFNNKTLDPALGSTSAIGELQYITEEELQPGDIGLIYQGEAKHTGIYMGNNTWIHCSSSGTVVVTENYRFQLYKRYHPSEMEEDNYYTDSIELYNKNSDFLYNGDEWYFISQVVLQECSSSTDGIVAVAECVRYRCLDSGFPDDPYSVLTEKKQFEAYGSGAYQKRTPTASQIELIKQAVDGTKSVLNDGRVLYFLSSSFHKSQFLTGKSWLVGAGYAYFGEYGDNAYYYNPSKAKPDISGALITKVNAETKRIPANGSNNGIVYFGQSNAAGGSEWASVPFGDKDIANSGCSVTCLAMVISYLKSGASPSGWVYPNQVVRMIEQRTGSYNTYHVPGVGQSHDIFPNVASWYGLACDQISSNSIEQSLKANRPVIMSCRPGEFTNKGHFIVITGYDSNGYYYVNDPSHPEKSSKKYTLSTLVKQGKGFWSFGRK